MINKILVSIVVLFIGINLTAQEYKFNNLVNVEASSVKSQDQTGTCWSFSTSSFIESEIFRLTGKQVDVSEMFTVRNTYDDKAWNYVMRQGKAQFSEGGLAHDVINSIRDNGIVPEIVFSGVKFNKKSYNHSNIVPAIKKVLDSFIKNDKHSKYPNWKKDIKSILDKEIGEIPTDFTYEGNEYTPIGFAKALKIEPNNYITITSFTQVPFYQDFILNIPDNFSNGSMYNVPLEELVDITTQALKSGYSIALDVDVSEKDFSAKYGLAVLPENKEDEQKALTRPVKEMDVTQEFRQKEFENYDTTDDHLMHITGIVEDQKGNMYYKVKNSWGSGSDRVGNKGYIYMSIPYFKLKAVSILLHKDGLPKTILEKIRE